MGKLTIELQGLAKISSFQLARKQLRGTPSSPKFLGKYKLVYSADRPVRPNLVGNG